MTPTADVALKNAPRSTFRKEIRKRVFTGSNSMKSSRPVRMCSEMSEMLVRKNAVKTCWMKWEHPTSRMTCQRFHPAMDSVWP